MKCRTHRSVDIELEVHRDARPVVALSTAVLPLCIRHVPHDIHGETWRPVQCNERESWETGSKA